MAVDRERGASWSAKLGPELLFWHFLFLTYRKVGGWFLFSSLYLGGNTSLEGESKAKSSREDGGLVIS